MRDLSTVTVTVTPGRTVTPAACGTVTVTPDRHLEENMTVTPTRPSPSPVTVTPTVTNASGDAPPPTVTYRLRNPWTPHLIGSCVLAAATTTGAFAGAFANDDVHALPAGLVLAGLVLVIAVHQRQDTWWQRAPKTAFKPANNV